MRRLPLPALAAAVVALLTPVLVGAVLPARAAAAAAQLTPAQLAEQFVARLATRDPAAAPCELLARPLRDVLVLPMLAGLDPRLPGSYSDANRTRACDVFVAIYNGYVDDGGIDAWVRTEAGAVEVVAQSDSALHLRVPVVRVLENERELLREPGVADAFAVREDGVWKLIWPSLLWELSSSDLGEPPTTLATLPPFLAALDRVHGEQLAREQRLVRDYLATRAPISSTPLSMSGRGSRVGDPARDIVDRDGFAISDQRRPPVDLRWAAVRTDGETITFELRFSGPVPPALRADFALRQGGEDGRSSGWRVTLDDGWASAFRGGDDEPIALRGLRASVNGDVLRLALPMAEARGEVRADRPFRWLASAWVEAPDDAQSSRWIDDAPGRRGARGPRPRGVTHRPAGDLTAVPGAVVAAANALSPQASPCTLMTRELREHVAARELLTHESVVAEPFGPDDATRLCDAYLLRQLGFGSGLGGDRGGWLSTEVGAARVVRERGGVAQLRARVVQRFQPDDAVLGSDEVVNLFVVREEGVWRLASFAGLLQLDIAVGTGATSLAAFRRERAERVALTGRLRRSHARLVQGLATLPRPVLRTLSCGTGPRATASGHAEPSARGWSGVHRLDDRLRPVRGPRAARIDIVDGRLSSGRGRMCWTFRTRGPVAERVDLDVLLGQESNGDDGRSASWSLRLERGRAVGLVEHSHGLHTAFALRASVRGRVVRVVVPAVRVRGAVRVGRPFGWSVISRTPDPDRPPASAVQWIDTLPALVGPGSLAGIRHRARG